MAIPASSRYYGANVVPVEVNGQVRNTMYPGEQGPFVFSYTKVLLGPRRLDQLAYEVYGDDQQWWRIADANPEIVDFFDLPPDTELRVPRD
ncbi:hypothetical protein [Actinomadura atramentaria]|uniref:hypothetical protein n=1 Tax=Actinomadura atramentaria TaxID=1990 RepID=UPI0003717B93|nr:hypothetical protein [Actinomadura atramentaria]